MTDVTVSPQDEQYLLDSKIALVPNEPLEGWPQDQDMFLNWIIEQFVTEEEEIKPLVNDFRRGLHDVDFNPDRSLPSDNTHRFQSRTQSRLPVLRRTTGGIHQRYILLDDSITVEDLVKRQPPVLLDPTLTVALAVNAVHCAGNIGRRSVYSFLKLILVRICTN
jgi:hypothetical protein